MSFLRTCFPLNFRPLFNALDCKVHTQIYRKQSTLPRLIKYEQNESYFVTTPIFYVNAGIVYIIFSVQHIFVIKHFVSLVEPHIGHIYTALLADASARFHGLIGCNHVVFSTGTDEHGLKIQQASLQAKQEPSAFCDDISGLFRKALDNCDISYTDYIRTTETRHKKNVQSFWVRICDIFLLSYIFKVQVAV